MNDDDLKKDRRSTRLSISIPVVISGMDADGNKFWENVRTLIVNKHGGRIVTTHRLTMGTEVLVENHALGNTAKANVVWLSDKHRTGDLHHVGLQLLEAQNVWGIGFPPDDWGPGTREQEPAAPPSLPSKPSISPDAGTRATSPAGEEASLRLSQEMQESADAHVRDFQDRLKQLTQRLGMELELELRARAAALKEHGADSLEKEVKVLRESLNAAREEIGKLKAGIEELKSHLQTPDGDPPTTPLTEAQRQLSALAKSIVESMNRAAETGLSEYRNLLQKENQENAERQRQEAEQNPPPPGWP